MYPTFIYERSMKYPFAHAKLYFCVTKNFNLSSRLFDFLMAEQLSMPVEPDKFNVLYNNEIFAKNWLPVTQKFDKKLYRVHAP